MRECVVVLGMHRSGTSVLSGLVSIQGFYLGADEMPVHEDNPKGYFENMKVWKLNQSILEAYNTSWDNYSFSTDQISLSDLDKYETKACEIIKQEFGSVKRIFLKDPRMCLLFPLWENVLTKMGYKIKVILAYRSPMEVAHSLKSRNEVPTEKSLMMWSHHFFQAEKTSRQHPRILVRYDTDIRELDIFCNKLGEFLGVDVDDDVLTRSNELYSPKLKHHQLEMDNISDDIPNYMRNFISILQTGKLGSIKKLDLIISEFYNSQNFYLYDEENLKNKIESLEGQVVTLNFELERSQNEVNFKLREIDQQQIRIDNSKQDYTKLQKEFAEVKGSLEKKILEKNSKLVNKETVIRNKDNEIANRDEMLVVGDEIFRKVFVNKKWNKKIGRSINGQNHFKIKRTVLPFAKNKDKQLFETKELIIESGLFSPFYYLTQNLDVLGTGIDPLHHFCQHGWKEGRNPSQYFDCKAYLKKNTDVAKSGKNPLAHYVKYGKAEGRSLGNDIPVPDLIKPSDDLPVSEQPCITLKKSLASRVLPEIPAKTNQVLVSMIVLTRDGLEYLKILLPALLDTAQDFNFELIVVDNSSSDDSIAFLEKYQQKINLNIIKNATNETFSAGNNQAAKQAKGKYLLLLNNDIEPMRGWLHYLVNIAETEENVGTVGACLIYPFKERFKRSCTVQHAGIAFRDEIGFFRPFNQSNGALIGSHEVLINSDKSASTAACLLIGADVFNEVGGLDECYNYGFEDVDLGLKVHRVGYRNVYCADSISLHYEFGTQNKNDREEVIKRREKNANLLSEKWATTVKQNYWKEKLFNESHLFAEKPLKVSIAVTDYGPNVTAGDYFTAQELAEYLEGFGWTVTYLSRLKDEWYQLDEDVDVLISLLDAYDLSMIPNRNTRLYKIAWARNWFDRWCEMSCFNDYDMVFASSSKSCEYVMVNSQQKPILLPIASNPNRFVEKQDCNNPEFFESDICFTGSYWDSPRDIMQALGNESLQKYRFSVYGANWDKFDKFKPYDKGFISYENIPHVYHHTKIVIDDANHVTKPYGAVNSRVFDALMSDALVITNGVEGSNDLFAGELPYYETSEELDTLLDFYLNDEEARTSKVQKLKSLIISAHTYEHRAESIRDALVQRFLSTSIAIKIPCPTWEGSYSWGDYHMAVLLKEQLEKCGHYVLLQILPEWDNAEGMDCDVAIVLRGLSRYKTKSHQINLMWNISHPDKVTLDEYEEYDKVFIASELWANKIAEQVNVPVDALLQCTDPTRFKEPDERQKKQHKQELLFVGNSRNVLRKVLKDVIPTDYDLAVYGKNWNKLTPKQYIKGDHLPNDELYQHYGSADILLNDHWDDMREHGFVSNRIYDGLACGAFIVTDEVKAMGELINYVQVYETPEELKEHIEYYMSHPEERLERSQNGMEFVIKNHTFKERAKVFSESIQALNK